MRPRVDIQGHRGARGLFPENTLEGFRRAGALGVAAFELDVGMTADGVVVVTHDLTLNGDITRDATGSWLPGAGPAIRSLGFSELQQFDVGRIRPGSRTAGLFLDQTPIDGARIPALADVLATLPDARFTVEVKTDPRFPDLTAAPSVLADATLAVIDAAGAASGVTLESFDWRVQQHVRRVRPDIRLAWLTRDETTRDAVLWRDGVAGEVASMPECVAAAGGPVWAPDYATLTEDHVRRAHALGLSVLAWTVNREADMVRLIGWGVDGLISDRPDVAMAIANAAVPPGEGPSPVGRPA